MPRGAPSVSSSGAPATYPFGVASGTSVFRPATVKYQNYPVTYSPVAGGLMVDGTMYGASIDLPAGLTVVNLHWIGSVTLVNNVSPHYWVALYDNTRTLLGQSTDNTSKAITATLISDALATPYVTTYAGQYEVCFMAASGGGTQPTYIGHAGQTSVNSLTMAGGQKYAGSSTASLTTTAPGTMAAFVSTSPNAWVGVS